MTTPTTTPPPTLKLDWCTHEAAKFAVERWHYSERMPVGKTVRIGVWESGQFIGVVIFGRGANCDLLKPYGLDQVDGAELVRVALRAHVTPVSRIMAIALRFLAKACPGMRLVVSFADPEQGHVGGIYQANGWVYAGMSTPADEYIVNGERIHGRSLRAARAADPRAVKGMNTIAWARLALDPNITKIAGSAKHRYLMPLDDEMRTLVARIAKPYPKHGKTATSAHERAGSIVGDVSAHQAGEGGSNPTPALRARSRARVTQGREQQQQRQRQRDANAPTSVPSPRS